MSTISAGTAPGTALVTSGDTTGQLVLQTNGTTTAVTIGTNQVVSLAQPLPVASGGTGATSLSAAGILTTGAAVTVAQGGTGSTSLTANNVLLGNGTSALQTVAPGTTGNVLTSNGTTWQSTAPAGGGSWVFLSSQTISSAVTYVTFSNVFSSTYDTYVVVFNGVGFSNSYAYTGGRLQVQVQRGGIYQTGGYAGTWGSVWGGGNSSTTSSGVISDISKVNLIPVNGYIYFFNVNNTSNSRSQKIMSTYTVDQYGASYIENTNTSSATTGFRFLTEDTNTTLDAGVFYLYGIKKS